MLDDSTLVIGKKVVTKDAYILGEVTDVRFESIKWNVIGLKLNNCTPQLGVLGSKSKSSILLQPDKFTINDVILSCNTLDKLREKITPDMETPSVKSLTGMKVLASDATLIGIVDSIDIDYIKWKLMSITIKVDKNACVVLGIKKGLFSKKATGILSTHIASVGESILLNLDTKGVMSQLVIL